MTNLCAPMVLCNRVWDDRNGNTHYCRRHKEHQPIPASVPVDHACQCGEVTHA